MKQLSEMTLEKLWQLFPILLRSYNPEWNTWYADEEKALKAALGTVISRIRHIGSTSVPGLTAKPTVDILLEIEPGMSVDDVRKSLTANGWTTMSEMPPPDYRLDMCKGYTPAGFAERVYHLHVRFVGDWDEPYFCEYLRRHPETAADYVALKTDLAKMYEHNRDAYTNAKGDFIRAVTARARQELRWGEETGMSVPRRVSMT